MVRDSSASRTAKLVAYTLSTYMDRRGVAWPSQALLASGCSLSVRAVQSATLRLEEAGLLKVQRSKGRGSHRYTALVPTANAVPRFDAGTANGASLTANAAALNLEPGSHESSESERESLKAGSFVLVPCDNCGKQVPVALRSADLGAAG